MANALWLLVALVALHIVSCSAKKLWAVLHPSDGLVAVSAEQPTDPAGLVAMVDRQATSSAPQPYRYSLRASTYRTDMALLVKELIVLCFCKAALREGMFAAPAGQAVGSPSSIAISATPRLRAHLAEPLSTIFAAPMNEKLRCWLNGQTLMALLRQAVRNWPSILRVMQAVRHGLAHDPSPSRACLWRNGRYLAAPTGARRRLNRGAHLPVFTGAC